MGACPLSTQYSRRADRLLLARKAPTKLPGVGLSALFGLDVQIYSSSALLAAALLLRGYLGSSSSTSNHDI